MYRILCMVVHVMLFLYHSKFSLCVKILQLSPAPLIPRDTTSDVAGFDTVLNILFHLKWVQFASCPSDICYGSSTDEFFLFRVQPSFGILLLWWFWCLLCNYRFWCGCSLCHLGLNHLSLHLCNRLEHTHGRYMFLLLFLVMSLKQLSPTHSISVRGHSIECTAVT